MMDLGWIYYFAVCLQWIIYPFCQLTQYMVSDLCIVILSFDTATCRISRHKDKHCNRYIYVMKMQRSAKYKTIRKQNKKLTNSPLSLYEVFGLLYNIQIVIGFLWLLLENHLTQ